MTELNSHFSQKQNETVVFPGFCNQPVKDKKSGTTFLNNAPRLQKEHYFFGGAPGFTLCPSGKGNM
jgi:hypothetical protein